MNVDLVFGLILLGLVASSLLLFAWCRWPRRCSPRHCCCLCKAYLLAGDHVPGGMSPTCVTWYKQKRGSWLCSACKGGDIRELLAPGFEKVRRDEYEDSDEDTNSCWSWVCSWCSWFTDTDVAYRFIACESYILPEDITVRDEPPEPVTDVPSASTIREPDERLAPPSAPGHRSSLRPPRRSMATPGTKAPGRARTSPSNRKKRR